MTESALKQCERLGYVQINEFTEIRKHDTIYNGFDSNFKRAYTGEPYLSSQKNNLVSHTSLEVVFDHNVRKPIQYLYDALADGRVWGHR